MSWSNLGSPSSEYQLHTAKTQKSPEHTNELWRFLLHCQSDKQCLINFPETHFRTTHAKERVPSNTMASLTFPSSLASPSHSLFLCAYEKHRKSHLPAAHTKRGTSTRGSLRKFTFSRSLQQMYRYGRMSLSRVCDTKIECCWWVRGGGAIRGKGAKRGATRVFMWLLPSTFRGNGAT